MQYLRGSAQKARLVVDMIRGKDVNQALAILRSRRSGRRTYREVHAFGDANANEIAEKANISIDPDDLGAHGVCRSWTNEEPSSCASGAAGRALSRAATFLSRDDLVE